MDGFRMILKPGQEVGVVLQWDEPFGAASDDLDLILFIKPPEGEWMLLPENSGLAVRDGDDDPLEFAYLKIKSSAPGEIMAAILIRDNHADRPRKLKMVLMPDPGVRFMTPRCLTLSGSIFGHKAVPDIVTVGAINVTDPNIDDIAPYSGRSPVQIAIPQPESRPKPDVVGLDCVTVSDASGLPSPFCGISAAAPHVTALAALLLGENDDPAVARPSVASVIAALKETAVDLGVPGFDNVYGAGRVDALSASRKLDRDHSDPPTVTGADIHAPADTVVTATVDVAALAPFRLTATSSNPVLLPDANIQGLAECTTAGRCRLTLKPVTNQNGETLITNTIVDGAGR